ncbi:unnamed protein product [Soboliphyme baturini]|uniref:Transposase n=1 Tax=Soboliphyme baturini TaxID=241478 RepID=A0A183IBQ6_9BILA|nr:unnamed protein product [Soboliphyme baturini]
MRRIDLSDCVTMATPPLSPEQKRTGGKKCRVARRTAGDVELFTKAARLVLKVEYVQNWAYKYTTRTME